MKKGIIVLLTAIIAVAGVFVFSSQYRDRLNEKHETSQTYKSKENGEEQTAKKVPSNGVIAECKEADYKLVIKGDKATVVHGKYSIDMSSRYESFIEETPVFHYFDFDGDGEKEVILRALYMRTKSASGRVLNKSYRLYHFLMRKNAKGEFLGFEIANDDMWKKAFENYIVCDFTQLKSNKKFLQFAMNNKGERIDYDEKTGITDNKYSGYAAASKSPLGEYYTMDMWSKGIGSFNIDDEGNITLDIQVLMQYKETKRTEEIGFIHCGIACDNKARFSIVPNTIKFIPKDEKRVSDPRISATGKWSARIENLSQAPAADTRTIDWIENSFDVPALEENKSMYFSELDSQIKNIESVTFNQDGITFTAKEGFGFAKNLVSSQNFTVKAKLDGKNEYDIGGRCEKSTANGRDTLVITFDNSYDKAQLKDLSVRFSG